MPKPTHAEAMAALERLHSMAWTPVTGCLPTHPNELLAILPAYMTPDPEIVRKAHEALHSLSCGRAQYHGTTHIALEAICAALPPLEEEK